jgi:hypothetical protein
MDGRLVVWKIETCICSHSVASQGASWMSLSSSYFLHSQKIFFLYFLSFSCLLWFGFDFLWLCIWLWIWLWLWSSLVLLLIFFDLLDLSIYDPCFGLKGQEWLLLRWSQGSVQKHCYNLLLGGVGFTSVVKSRPWLRHFALNASNWVFGLHMGKLPSLRSKVNTIIHGGIWRVWTRL